MNHVPVAYQLFEDRLTAILTWFQPAKILDRCKSRLNGIGEANHALPFNFCHWFNPNFLVAIHR